ncbi:ankyrin repeat and SOCS box protein 2-like [Liolophura sinensis]|uniref:ankyrin repeat and SOCS box protein 2-like n=1 Tax=Liolophura sinensis TaxID=3198878 RepID=UPI003158C73D
MLFSEAYQHTCSATGLAARGGDLNALKELLQNGASIDVQDNRGWTPIHEAAFHNHPLCLHELLTTKFCIKDKSFVNKLSFEEETALILASRRGNVECVRTLIEHGADLNIPKHGALRLGFTPLWEGIFSKNVGCVRLLLEHCDSQVVNLQTFDGRTPLHLAAENGQSDLIVALLQHGARLDVYDDNHLSPLFVAAQMGNYDSLKLLLEAAIAKGQPELVNKPAFDKATPLFLATQKGHVRCVELLLANGADPHLKTENPTTLPVHAAVQFRYHSCMELLLPVTSPRAIAECGISLVDVLLPNLDLRCFQTLIKHGVDLTEGVDIIPADLTQENTYHLLPFVTEEPLGYKCLSLIGLCVGGDEDTFLEPSERCNLTHCLLAAGLEPEPQITAEIPPLVAAVYANNVELFKVLLEHGVDVHVSHPEFLGDMAVTVAAGLDPPSPCLLLLFLHGASVDSCFGHIPEGEDLDIEPAFRTQKWCIQNMLMMYPGQNHWQVWERLTHLLSLAWHQRLHPGLQAVIRNSAKWKQLQDLAAECSTLAHLCRRQIFRTLASTGTYNSESLEKLEMPVTLKHYLFSSVVGKCYRDMLQSL